MAKLRMSAGFGGLSGRAGNVVYAQTQYGTVMRDRPMAPRGRTAAQDLVARNLRQANAAWRGLSMAQVQAWQVYCLGLAEENGLTGLTITPQAPHVFLGYATKILQMNPSASVPVDPPATPFYGDSLHCTLVAGAGGVTVHASAPNSPGVSTEILVQRIRHVHNKPQSRSYKTAAFKAFASGSLAEPVPLVAGSYAVAIRFVDAGSGRMTAVYPVGKVVVGLG